MRTCLVTNTVLGLLLLVLAMGVGLVGCGAPQSLEEEGVALLVIESQPSNPVVYIDGMALSTPDNWRDHTIPVPAGARLLELRAEGYYPHRRDLNLKPGLSYTLRVELVRRLD